MKKFLLLVLSLSVLAVLSACSDSGSSNNGGGVPVTQPNMTDPNSLVGTYTVVSFETQAAGYTFSNNCTTATCMPVTMYGNNFTMQLVNGALVAESQMQMYNTIMSTASKNDIYQYIKYADMPLTDLANMQNSTTPEFTGITGRNLTSSINITDAKFTFTLNADGTITNNLTFTKELGEGSTTQTITTVKLQKISDTVVTINPNSLIVPAAQISDPNAQNDFYGFVENITAQ